MTDTRDDILRAVRFERPTAIPMVFHINEASWHHYPEDALKELMGTHPILFPDFDKQSRARPELDYTIIERPDRPFTDGWGCVWETSCAGIVGCVTRHPLANWSDFDEYVPPDPGQDTGKGPVDWNQIAANLKDARANGQLTIGGLRHGHSFQTLADIRGFENLLIDMIDHHPRLTELIAMVEAFNLGIVQRYIDLGVEWMCYPEDLGMQAGPMISPDLFCEFIQPSYARLIQPARDAGCVIHMHSDGQIHDLLDPILSAGADVINLQDLVNGIDWIRGRLAGKVCIELDIDRQQITAFGTAQEVDALIREEVSKLGSPQGGLMMIYGLYPGIPLANVRALMDAMERYAGFYA